MDRRFLPSVTPPSDHAGPAWWFVFRGGDILLIQNGEPHAIPYLPEIESLSLTPRRSHFLGFRDDVPSYAVEVDAETPAPNGLEFTGLRGLHGRVEDDLFALAGRASQVLEWDRSHQFCGRCGTPTVDSATERAKVCPVCGYTVFPRLSPAIIVLVERGDEALLARGPQFVAGRYAVIAGFVEPGESLENAVAREIGEEVGIAVKDIRYFGSQPWPFPHQVMIGFTAQYAGGEITIDGAEIEDAGWFRAANLPGVPQKLSISRWLIDAFAAKHGVVIEEP
jgi:NAD+ diphosphatase